ncbi:hypothetical protein WA026_004405 [Henosepilachna vigintioctopunctata]|uniref:Uncharacterized protein n=1 Tax=Henosepilachna vigintioctopunctata TaxID=420089 RepID=A0AAW1V0F0_9CUCU
MRTLLSKKGYNILEVEDWDNGRKYDLIMCLNLIDRCNTPMQLLKRIRQALQPGGLVFLALVLPFSAYVEIGSKTVFIHLKICIKLHMYIKVMPILKNCAYMRPTEEKLCKLLQTLAFS